MVTCLMSTFQPLLCIPTMCIQDRAYPQSAIQQDQCSTGSSAGSSTRHNHNSGCCSECRCCMCACSDTVAEVMSPTGANADVLMMHGTQQQQQQQQVVAGADVAPGIQLLRHSSPNRNLQQQQQLQHPQHLQRSVQLTAGGINSSATVIARHQLQTSTADALANVASTAAVKQLASSQKQQQQLCHQQPNRADFIVTPRGQLKFSVHHPGNTPVEKRLFKQLEVGRAHWQGITRVIHKSLVCNAV